MKNYTLLEVGSIQGIKVYNARKRDFKALRVKSSINLLNPSQEELEDALDVASRDLFDCIICYELTDKEFTARQKHYLNKA